MLYPGQIVDYRLYGGSGRFLGHGNEVTLPTVTSKTYTADLPAGELDLPGMRTENMEIEIPFNVFDAEAASLISLTNTTKLDLYGVSQSVDSESHNFDYKGLKVTVQGFAKELSIGTLKRSDGMDSKVKMTITKLTITGLKAGEDNTDITYLNIDKLNGTYEVYNPDDPDSPTDVRSGISDYL